VREGSGQGEEEDLGGTIEKGRFRCGRKEEKV
jgi:hypothetical protein